MLITGAPWRWLLLSDWGKKFSMPPMWGHGSRKWSKIQWFFFFSNQHGHLGGRVAYFRTITYMWLGICWSKMGTNHPKFSPRATNQKDLWWTQISQLGYIFQHLPEYPIPVYHNIRSHCIPSTTSHYCILHYLPWCLRFFLIPLDFFKYPIPFSPLIFLLNLSQIEYHQ